MKTFKPLLAPNDEIDINSISFPLFASIKLDGCRLVIYKGKFLTRSLKNLPNKQLREKFEELRKYTEDKQIILDGEVYAHGIPFQFIVSCFMTHDCYDKKAIKKWKELCDEHEVYISREDVLNNLQYHCFDYLTDENLEFQNRISNIKVFSLKNLFVSINQRIVNSKEEVNRLFKNVLEEGYEGLILRNPKGKYKYGRATLLEANIYKYKPFVTLDAQVIDIVQATEVREGAEKKTNELGRSVTSKKKDDRVLIEKASAFKVLYEGKELKVVLAMTDEEKEEVWKNPHKYIGRWIEYKGMLVGSKDLPRSPNFIRFRDDKN